MSGLGLKIKMADAFVTLGVMDNLKKGLSKAEDKLKAFAQRTGSMATKLAGASLAVLGPGALSATTFAGFEQSMARVRGLTAATTDEFKMLWDQAKNLGATTQFTARDAAAGMAFYAQAGFKVTEINNAMLPTLDLAAAGQMDVAESADILAKIMHGMGVPASDLGYHVDVLTQAMSTANTDLRQLGDAFKYAGAVAKTAGLSFEETTAFLQMMSNAGIQADMAGTTLRGALLAITSPSAGAAAMMKKLKIDTNDANGNLLSMADIISQFDSAMAGMGTQERLNILGQIFDNRQASGFAEAIAQGGDALKAMTESLRDSDGAARRFAGIQMNTLNGQWLLFTSAVETLKISIGEVVAQPLRSLLRGLTEIVSASIRFVEANQWVIIVLGVLGGLLATAAAYFLLLTSYAMIAQMAIQLYGFAIAGATKLMQIATITAKIFGATISLMANPFFLIGAAIVGLVAAVAYLSGAFDRNGGYIASVFSWLYETIVGTVQGMYNAIVAGRLDLAFQILMTSVAYVLTVALQGIVSVFGGHIDMIAAMIGGLYKFFGRLMAWFNEIRVMISNWITGVIGWIMGLDTSLEQKAAADSARKWAQEWENMDTSGIADSVANALDPNQHKQKLKELMDEAAKAREAAYADPNVPQGPARPGAPTPLADGVIGMEEAKNFASKGSFSVGLLARQLPGAKSNEQKVVQNTQQTVKELQKIGATLAGGAIGGLAFGP